MDDVKEQLEKLTAEIEQLNTEKKQLIEKITKLMKEHKYTKIEYDALLPLAKKAEEMNIGKLMRTLKKLEFKVATTALTPKREKVYFEKIVQIEKKIKKLRPYLRAVKRVKLLKEDIDRLDKEIKDVESKLKEMRKQIAEKISKKKTLRKALRKGVGIYEEPDTTTSLEDIVVIEED